MFAAAVATATTTIATTTTTTTPSNLVSKAAPRSLSMLNGQLNSVSQPSAEKISESANSEASSLSIFPPEPETLSPSSQSAFSSAAASTAEERNYKDILVHSGLKGLSTGADVLATTQPLSSADCSGNGCAAFSVEKSTRNESTEDSKDEKFTFTPTSTGLTSPLPDDLFAIMTQVAKTGTCSWLPWSYNQPVDASNDTNNQTSLARNVPNASTCKRKASSVMDGTSRSRLSRQSSLPRKKYCNGDNHYHHDSQYTSQPDEQEERQHQKSSNNFQHNSASASYSNGVRRELQQRKRPLTQRLSDSSSLASEQTSPAFENSSQEGMPALAYDTASSGNSVVENFLHLEREDGSYMGSCDDHQALSDADINKDLTTDLVTGKEEGRYIGNNKMAPSLPFLSQKDAFREALNLVLNYFYATKGEYELSVAEKRQNGIFEAKGKTSEQYQMSQQPKQLLSNLAHNIFQQRKQRLLSKFNVTSSNFQDDRSPPFTIQRVAEVLINPDRYYTQTHKLCNSLEKLLLVTSSLNAFGGVTGGDTFKSRSEARELTALVEEQERMQSEFRQRRKKRAASSSPVDEGNVAESLDTSYSNGSPIDADERKIDFVEELRGEGKDLSLPSQEMLEAAARASLRTKFDHVCIDPISTAVNRDMRVLAETRGLTNSPPPPGLGIGAALPGVVLPGQCTLLRHGHSDLDHPSSLVRAPSPPIAPVQPSTSIQLMQIHNAAALADASPLGLASPNNKGNATSSYSLHSPSAALTSMAGSKEYDLESRSSASSDVDSESDVSFDDSASDRSDGSDSLLRVPWH